MKLPRSVQLISDDDFKPRRCDSEVFRGFSYIQEDFVLPERSASKEEHYWNNCDEDGESRSDCASSIYGEEVNNPLSVGDGGGGGNNNNNIQPTLQSTPENPE